MMKGTGLGYGNLPTDRELTKEAFRLIAASESRKALREAEEQAKENALREARRLRNGAAKKNLEGEVVAEDDGGNVTRNRGNVCNLASKYPTHINGVDATARSMATPEREAYCADRDEHRILRNIAEAKKRAGRRASAVDEAIDLLDGKVVAE